MKTSRQRKRSFWIKVIIALVILISISIMYYELRFFDILIGMLKLSKKDRKLVKVSKKSLIYMMDKASGEELFFTEMEKLGWTYYDRYGRGYLFTKEGEEILATKSLHFNKYIVFEIHNEDYFNYMNGELS